MKLFEQNTESEDKLTLLRQNYQLLEEKYRDHRKNTLEAKNELQALKNQYESVSEDLAETTRQLMNERQQQERLVEKNTKLKEQLRQQQQVIQEFQDEREDIQELRQELDEESMELVAQQKRLAEHQQKQAAFNDAKNNKLMALIEKIEFEKQELQSQARESQRLETKVNYLEQSMQQQEAVIASYIKANIQWEHLHHIQTQHDEMTRKAAYLEEENQRLKSTLATAQEFMEQTTQEAERAQTAERQMTFYKIRMQNLEREIMRYQKREQEAVSDESRIFESFQLLIEQHQKTEDTLLKYPGDSAVVKRIMNVAAQGNYEFSEEIIQAFIAAMRSTRFMILKGLSGTGKTSLPKIVAHALGGVCETIAVQPNWKSKTDLIGFYNHFNDRFMATQFTEELFKAQLPENRDRFYFIVLDEMNLARVEYYFSDFNSKLELEQSKQVIELFDTMGRTTGTLAEYIVDGNKLRIPPNVFFIGTINEDDSTYTLSDKIYDRAQVLDFQAALSHKVGNMEAVDSEASVRFSDFQAQNMALQKQDVSAMMQPINEVMKVLSEDLFLEIGNRPRRHMRTFLQTYAQNNWPKVHARDLQIVSKIVPKIMPSYDEEFEIAMDKIIAIIQRDLSNSQTAKAISKVKRNAR